MDSSSSSSPSKTNKDLVTAANVCTIDSSNNSSAEGPQVIEGSGVVSQISQTASSSIISSEASASGRSDDEQQQTQQQQQQQQVEAASGNNSQNLDSNQANNNSINNKCSKPSNSQGAAVASLNAVEKVKRKSGGGSVRNSNANTTKAATNSRTKSKMSNRAGLNFIVGSKLEAKDFNEKWYSAKVVETDWSEREVLIHFEKWNSRYDEWIPMDSSRLRVLQTSPRDAKAKEFTVGERILATWADGKKYPAKVNAALGNDKYDVLFDDGYSKQLKSSKMTKIVEFAVAASKFDEQQNQQQCVLQQQQNTYVGSKQERRDKKRKHTVTELFHPKKRTKSDSSDRNVKKQEQSANLPAVKSIAKADNAVGPASAEANISIDSLQNVPTSGCTDDDYATYIGDLRVEIEDSMYKCPISGCNKNFRKENLLQMHIKHYHPEYSKYLGSTPNVADLAYARTIGESVEDVLPKKPRVPPPPQANQTVHMSPSISQTTDTDLGQTDTTDNKLDTKIYSENNTSLTEDNSSEQSNSCTMSPGTLFDMRYKEERTHTGIKTLPPVRHVSLAALDDCEPSQNSGVCTDLKSIPNEKPKPQRRRQHSESRRKSQQKSISEQEESLDHFEDSMLDGDDTIDSSYKCNNSSNRSELDNADSMQSQNENIIIIDGEIVKVEKLRREEIINCICSITEEDGLMIQCDLCLCWQHGICNNIEKEKDVPEKYVCYICQNSLRQRPSKKYIHDQDWIREGKLPTMQTSTDKLKINEKSAMLKRSYDLVSGLMQMKDILHSLRVKINMAQNKDHPKLYLWAKNWSKIEIPEFPVDPVPIIEIIKVENPTQDLDETAQNKLDFSFSLKTEPDQKSITSDTELMNILEDGTQSDKSKLNSRQVSSSKNDDQNPANTLSMNGIKEEYQPMLQVKQEPSDGLSSKYNSQMNDFDKMKSTVFGFEAGEKTLNQLQRPVIPEPEAPIDPVDCKLRLLEHIEYYQNYVEKALHFVDKQLSALENMNSDNKRDTSKDVRTKQTILMILRDLESMRKMAALSKINQA